MSAPIGVPRHPARATAGHPALRLMGYGRPGVPLLPAGLRAVWEGVEVPEAVCSRGGLPPRTTADQLDASVWARIGAGGNPAAVVRWLARQIGWHSPAIAGVRPVPEDWPSGLDSQEVPWSGRTRSSLRRHGLLEDLRALSRLDCRHLLAVPRFGAHSLLDYAACAEAAFQLVTAPGAPAPGPAAGTRDWAGAVSGADPRFSDLLGADPRPVAARLAAAAADLSDPEHWRFLNHVVPAVAKRVAELQMQPLETALLNYLAAVTGLRGARLSALAARLGWTLEPAITLQTAADRLGLTRERVRQLEADARERLAYVVPWLPQLDDALELVARHDVPTAEQAARLLAEHGLAGQQFDAASAAAVARDCHRAVPPALESLIGGAAEPGRTEPAAGDAGLALADAIAAAVQLESRRRGAARRDEVMAADTDPQLATEALAVLRDRGMRTTGDGRWLFFPPSWRCRVMGAVRDMLAVTDPLPLLHIHEGVERRFAFRQWGPALPRRVLGEVLATQPRLAVTGGEVTAHGQLDWREELSGYEQLLVAHLLAGDDTIARTELLELFARNGYSDVAAYQCWNCSVVLDHVGGGRAALVGRVDPLRER